MNEELKYDDFRELAQLAIDILEIEFELTDKEPSLACIAKMERISNPEIHLFEQWENVRSKIPNLPFYEGHNEVIFPEFGNSRGLKELDDFQSPAVSLSLGGIDLTRNAIELVFKSLLEIKKPWNSALVEIIDNESNTINKSVIEINLIGSSKGLIHGYSPHKGKIKQLQYFMEFSDDPRDVFFWNIAISNIFLKFLELGGKDYFGFCDYCGEFFVVQRKGRKKFCSDKHRVYANEGKEYKGK